MHLFFEMTDGIAVAQRILDLAESDDFEGILSLGILANAAKLSRKSSPAELKRAYLKLSLIIHPDRLQTNKPLATKAFQALVKSYEFLSSPDITPDKPEQSTKGKKKQEKVVAISRSNDGDNFNTYLILSIN